MNVQPQKDDDRTTCAVVAFMDIKSASKAHSSDNVIDGQSAQTGYNEPTATAAVVTATRTPDSDTSVSSREHRTSGYSQRVTGRYPARAEG